MALRSHLFTSVPTTAVGQPAWLQPLPSRAPHSPSCHLMTHRRGSPWTSARVQVIDRDCGFQMGSSTGSRKPPVHLAPCRPPSAILLPDALGMPDCWAEGVAPGEALSLCRAGKLPHVSTHTYARARAHTPPQRNGGPQVSGTGSASPSPAIPDSLWELVFCLPMARDFAWRVHQLIPASCTGCSQTASYPTAPDS